MASVRHPLFVRITHWINALCFFALLVSGAELVISHPRFYWGEDGNSLTEAAFQLPIPASRAYVKTGYNYVLPDQNGWSRSLHFQTAWIVVFTGLSYAVLAYRSGHIRGNLWPSGTPGESDYSAPQRVTYLLVIFGLLPLLIWTGLAMSPALTAAYPFLVDAMGGQQSARTIHFFASVALFGFFVAHVVMVVINGFRTRVVAMFTGAV